MNDYIVINQKEGNIYDVINNNSGNYVLFVKDDLNKNKKFNIQNMKIDDSADIYLIEKNDEMIVLFEKEYVKNILLQNNYYKDCEKLILKLSFEANTLLIINNTQNNQYQKFEVNNLDDKIGVFNFLLNEKNKTNAKILNEKISYVTLYYEHCDLNIKKKSFLTMKNEFVKMLNEKSIDENINLLNKKNRKLFEAVLISDNVEEYELLREIIKERKVIDSINNNQKELIEKNKEIITFNNRLLSSRSWKLTRFLRIKEKISKRK